MNNLRDTFRELREIVDGGDPFMRSGHQILVERKHKRIVPDWARSDKEIRKLLLRSFPRLHTDKKQAAGAGRWTRVIQLYFRMGKTHGQIAEEMELGYNMVRMIIRATKWAAQGKRTDGSGKFRPKA